MKEDKEVFFYGVGVGPGEPGLLPHVAWKALQQCDVIFAPRAESASTSLAKETLKGLDLPQATFHEFEFEMSGRTTSQQQRYEEVARKIMHEIQQGRKVAFLTLGDSMTFSTYNYTLEALLKMDPQLGYQTFPGVTSFAALAAKVGWPLGIMKNDFLVLPCPDDTQVLQDKIKAHELVVLMKIGKRLPTVIEVLRDIQDSHEFVLGKNIGLEDECIVHALDEIKEDLEFGYFSTMLIRRKE